MAVLKSFLFVTTGLGTGGAEAMLVRVISQLRDEGHHIYVVNLTDLTDHQAKLEAQSVTIFNAPLSRPFASFLTLWQVRQQMKSVQPLAIIGWMYVGNLISYLLHSCLPSGPKLVWSVRQSLDFWASEKASTKCAIWLSRFLSGRVDELLFNAHLSARQHIDFGFHSKKHTVIGNGFYLPSADDIKKNRASYRKILGVDDTDIVLGAVGRFHPVKGYDVLSSAWQMATSKGAFVSGTPYLCVIGDTVPEGWQAIDGASVNVFLHDRHPDAISFMCAFDGLILSSYAEAFPNVIGEAMSVKLPVIASDVGDVVYLVPDNDFIFARGDAHALAEKIESFWLMDKVARQQIGDKNQEAIRRQYDMKYIIENYKISFGL